MIPIGQQIKQLREEKRITGKDLAQRIGLSQSQMSRLEQGQRRVDSEVLQRIAEALGVPPSRFFAELAADPDPLSARREKELSVANVHGELGRRIRHERRQRHLTAEDLARKTGQTKAYVIAIEEGRRNGLEGDFLRKACRLLGIDPFSVIEIEERIIDNLKERLHRLDRDRAAVAAGVVVDGARGTPILVGDESLYPAEFDDNGQPIAAVEGFLTLPDLWGRTTFALRVRGDEMDPGHEPRFVEGDLVVFATDRAAASGEYAFVRDVRNRTVFRRLFLDADATVRLQAARADIAPLLLPVAEIRSAWPLVALVRSQLPGA
ncbi:MAG: helix-turn-helix domain-containing protein [Planctomycetota bacterium]